MSTPLSPTAQAVEDAYFNADGFGYRNGLAAALREAALRLSVWSATESGEGQYLINQDDLFAIAAELEGQ
jgi:hypothetical protein